MPQQLATNTIRLAAPSDHEIVSTFSEIAKAAGPGGFTVTAYGSNWGRHESADAFFKSRPGPDWTATKMIAQIDFSDNSNGAHVQFRRGVTTFGDQNQTFEPSQWECEIWLDGFGSQNPVDTNLATRIVEAIESLRANTKCDRIENNPPDPELISCEREKLARTRHELHDNISNKLKTMSPASPRNIQNLRRWVSIIGLIGLFVSLAWAVYFAYDLQNLVKQTKSVPLFITIATARTVLSVVGPFALLFYILGWAKWLHDTDVAAERRP